MPELVTGIGPLPLAAGRRFGRVVPKTKFYEHGNVSHRTPEKFVARGPAHHLGVQTRRRHDPPPRQQDGARDPGLRRRCQGDDVSDNVLAAIDKAVQFPIIFEIASKAAGCAHGRRPQDTARQAPKLSAYFTTDWLPADAPRSPLPTALDLPSLYTQLLNALFPRPACRGDVSEAPTDWTRLEAPARDRGPGEGLRTEPQFNRKVELRRQLKDRTSRARRTDRPEPQHRGETVDKLKMHSPDLTQRNIDKIAELFPTVITETLDDDGNPVRAIDFDLLRQELSDHIVEGPQERYQLDWPGKRAAAFAANAPIAKTLRPVREESVDFDTTKNLFIEGDNLDALKLLQESYLGKVKLIYIDPPYNTGNDFVYEDDFAESSAEYLSRWAEVEDWRPPGRKPETNGRFHSDWLSMMYPRLKLARNLLSRTASSSLLMTTRLPIS